MDEAEDIATDMQYYLDQDLLSGDILMQEFDAKLIHSLLGMDLGCRNNPSLVSSVIEACTLLKNLISKIEEGYDSNIVRVNFGWLLRFTF